MTDVAQGGVGNGAMDAEVIDVEVVDVEDVEEGGTGVDAHVPPGDLSAQVADVIRERDEFLDVLQRTRADFANFRKRAQREQQDAVTAETVAVIRELIVPVLDALDAGVGAQPEAVGPVRWAAIDAAGRAGLERLDPTGEVFDPEAHEAVAEVDGGGEPDKVRAVYRAGYRWRGRLVRPAQVEVSKG